MDNNLSADAVSREVAEQINPLIGTDSRETLERCSGAILELGALMSDARSLSVSCMFRLTDAIAAALRYEGNQIARESRRTAG